MGILMTKFMQLFWSQEEYKVIITGLDNAGKTTILYQLLMNEVVVTSPTIGSNVEEVQYKNIHFVMWDIGGQESLRSSWATYYANTRCVILVIDSTDRERLSISKEELYRMLAHEDLRKACFACVRKQAGCEGLDVRSGDIIVTEPHFNQGTWMAHPGLLCADGRRSLSGTRLGCLSSRKVSQLWPFEVKCDQVLSIAAMGVWLQVN
eukprot:Opistho-2@40153